MKMHSAELKATAEQQWHEKVERKANEGLGFGKKKKSLSCQGQSGGKNTVNPRWVLPVRAENNIFNLPAWLCCGVVVGVKRSYRPEDPNYFGLYRCTERSFKDH